MAATASRREFARTERAGRRLASPQLRGLIGRRLAELGGLALALGGVTLLIALASYSASDPSLDTAARAGIRNLAGPVGAMIADLLLQFFGVSGVLPALAMLAWAWRLAAHRGFGAAPLRLMALLLALPALAGLLAAIPLPIAWPSPAGLGGAIGGLVAATALAAGRGLLGPLGAAIVLALGGTLTASLILLGFGLSLAEWRAAGGGAIRLTGSGVRYGRDGAGRLARLWRAAKMRLAPILGRDLLASPPEGFVPEGFAGAARAVAPPPEDPPAAPPAPRARVIAPLHRSKPTPRQEALPLPQTGWQFPALSLLKPAPARGMAGPSADALEANARLLESVLADYGVQGTIRDIRPGPVVTLYELEPAPGIRSARVIGLADDIARSLSVVAVRIATVPGCNVIGIEVPNAKRETVYLSELLESEEWRKHSGRLALALGKDISGAPVIADLARMPHLLIAGTTGSGKSVGVNAMILSLLYRLSPDQCRLIMIDPKMLELSVYQDIPHLMAPVVTEPAKAVTALKWTVREMERRYRAMSQLGVRNIGGYNERVAEARERGEVVTRRVQTGFDAETGRAVFEDQPLALEPLPFIVVVIDEMADLMMVAGKEIEAAVQRLAQMARAAGIHVIMATQRPSVDVITGTIKANFPTRISFQVISKFDSRTILGEQGAEQLLGQGDMLYMMGGGRITRTHGPFVSDREVEDVVAFLRSQGEPAYLEEVTEADAEDDAAGGGYGGGPGADGEMSLFDQAVDLVAREGKASTSFLQRHLQIGYNRAAKLIEQMEKEGIVSAANHVGKREVLARRPEE